MQVAVVEFARHVAGLDEANSAEFNPVTPHPVIDLMLEQQDVADMGGTMRLGTYPCKVIPGTKGYEIYGEELIYERHRHRYEVNNAYREQLVDAGLVITGVSPDERLVEMVELPDHPFFVGNQGHPEFKSRPTRPAPLFREFIGAAVRLAERRAAAGAATTRRQRRRPPQSARPQRPRAPDAGAPAVSDARLLETFLDLVRIDEPDVRRGGVRRATAPRRSRPAARTSRSTAPRRTPARTPATSSPGSPARRRACALVLSAHLDTVEPGRRDRAGRRRTASSGRPATRSSAPTTRPGSRRSSRRSGASTERDEPHAGITRALHRGGGGRARGAKALDRRSSSRPTSCSCSTPRARRGHRDRGARRTTRSAADFPARRRTRASSPRTGASALVMAARGGRGDASSAGSTTRPPPTSAPSHGGTATNVVAPDASRDGRVPLARPASASRSCGPRWTRP